MAEFIDLIIEEGDWNKRMLKDASTRVFEKVFSVFDISTEKWSVSLLACNDERMKVLNQEFREKDRATNVLSWPTFQIMPDEAGKLPNPNGFEDMIGDIALGFETIQSEAKQFNRSFEEHLLHLILHGGLHLLGFDHQNPTEATKMERTEIQILASLGVDDPYKDIDIIHL